MLWLYIKDISAYLVVHLFYDILVAQRFGGIIFVIIHHRKLLPNILHNNYTFSFNAFEGYLCDSEIKDFY
jgi:hypothetical protein